MLKILLLIILVILPSAYSKEYNFNIETYESPKKNFKIIKKCSDNFVCDFFMTNKNKQIEEKEIITNISNSDVVWHDNLATIDYDGCGTSCFNTAIVNENGNIDYINNTLFIDGEKKCAIYPSDSDLIVKKLFTDNIIKVYSFSKSPYKDLQLPANMAMAEGEKHNNDDVLITYPDENGNDVNLILTEPCL